MMKIHLLSLFALLLTMVQGAWADDKADYGVLNGEFSVSAVKKVHFSRGNLRAYYHSAGVWAWSFATNQYDYVGKADGNTLISGNGTLSSTNHYVDLFCWSTNDATYYGIHNSTDNGTYNGSFNEWGTNAISNGGDKANIWYTPSQDEWTYLMNTRSGSTVGATANARYTYATINTDGTSENGMILFPDGVTFEASEATTWGTINGNSDWTTKCTTDQWAALEAKGCVLLPTAGYRSGNGGGGAEDRGRYWLATSKEDDSAYSIFFGTASGDPANDYYRRFGRSVRLVIESHTITYNANGGVGSVDVLPKYTGLDRTLSDGTGLTRSGYILDGWATTADGAKVYDLGATYTADADVTLYAHWTPVNDVTWDATDEEKNNWTISPVNPVTVGAAVTATYNGSRHVKSVTYRPAGTIGGQFTINGSGDKVYFSKGNLQLVGANTWQFADNQWDYFGTSQSDNHRDLFGWGTKTDPNKTSNESTSYSWNEWGENAITNGGNRINSGWRTLESTEWAYLLNSRTTTTTNMPTGTNSDYARYIKAQVASENGLILFPDKYAHPADASVTVSSAAYNTANKGYGSFTVNAENWTKMEEAGAVFLPAGGYRHGTEIIDAGSYGAYWSSTSTSSNKATSMDFSSSTVEAYNTNRSTGCSVRLVRPVVELSPNAEKTVWTLASMPAYDIELSAEYYDEVTLTDGEAITALNTYTGQEIWVNYTRSFTADKASTVCLPFAYTKKTGDGSFYAFSGIEKVGSEYIATMTEPGTSTLTANTPYLYKAATTGDADFSGTYAIPASITAGTTTSGDWTFKGTYSTIEWTSAPEDPTYGFSAQDANAGITQGQFVKVGSYVRIKPMRAYLQYNGSDSQFTNARSLTRAAATTSDDTLPETIGVRLISANGEVTAIGTLYTRTGEVSFDSEAWYTLDGKRLNAKPNTKGIYVNNGKKVVIK